MSVAMVTRDFFLIKRLKKIITRKKKIWELNKKLYQLIKRVKYVFKSFYCKIYKIRAHIPVFYVRISRFLHVEISSG